MKCLLVLTDFGQDLRIPPPLYYSVKNVQIFLYTNPDKL